jgi:hypothetical protein
MEKIEIADFNMLIEDELAPTEPTYPTNNDIEEEIDTQTMYQKPEEPIEQDEAFTPEVSDVVTVPSFVEKLLKNAGIEDGMIEYEDGTQYHFSELPEDEQLNILKEIFPREEKRLTEEEQAIIDSYQKGLLVPYTSEKTNEYLGQLEQVKNLTDDELFISNFISQFQEDIDKGLITDADIEEELESAKENRFFANKMQKLRNDWVQAIQETIQNEQEQIKQTLEEKTIMQEQELEADRIKIISDVDMMREVSGISLSDEDKEELLPYMLEFDDENDNLAYNEIFKNGESIFKALWFLTKGEQILRDRELYYQKEIEKLKKQRTQPQSAVKTTTQQQRPISNNANEGGIDLSDFIMDNI